MPWLYSGETKTNASSEAILAAHRFVCGCSYLPIDGGVGSSSNGSSKSLMSTSSYSASLRFRAASSTHFAMSRDLRFGRVLPVMIPILSIRVSFVIADKPIEQTSALLRSSPGRSAELLEERNE